MGALLSFGDLVSANLPVGVAPYVSLYYAEAGEELAGGPVTRQLTYGDRQWSLGIEALPGSPFAPDRSGAWSVLAMGVVASALAWWLVFVLRQRLQTATALAAAEQATTAKDRFIAAVSHELRTPLTAVLGFAEILKTSANLTTVERVAMMKAITEEATDLAYLIDDLLVTARGEIGQLSIADSPIALRHVVESVVAASGIGPSLRVVPGGEAVVARGDPVRIRQIVRNLVENARKHGGKMIEIELSQEDSRVLLEVRDNGAGISADVAERAFHRYQHFDERVGLTESLGLGLTVSAQLATLMGGALRYDRRDEWTVFTLTLPCDRARIREMSDESVSSS